MRRSLVGLAGLLAACGGDGGGSTIDARVCGVQCFRDLLDDAYLVCLRQNLAKSCKRGPLNQLHRDVRLSFHFADFVDLADVFSNTKKASNYAKLRRWEILAWLPCP